MKKDEWVELWSRIKSRYPKWTPSKVESEDWCLALKSYDAAIVEIVSREVRIEYTSGIPTLKWYLKKLEAIKKKEAEKIKISNEADPEQEWQDALDKREKSIERLENTDIGILREAGKKVLAEYGSLISHPKDSNVRDWPNTFRSCVFMKIYGDESDD